MTTRTAYGARRKRSKNDPEESLDQSRGPEKKKKTSNNTILYDTMNMFDDSSLISETDKLAKSANSNSLSNKHDDDTTNEIIEPSTEISMNEGDRLLHSVDMPRLARDVSHAQTSVHASPESSVIVVEDTLVHPKGETPLRSTMKRKNPYIKREKKKSPPPPPPSLKQLTFERDMLHTQFSNLQDSTNTLKEKHNVALFELKQLQDDFQRTLIEKDKEVYSITNAHNALLNKLDEMKRRLQQMQETKTNDNVSMMRLKKALMDEKQKRTIVTQKYLALKEVHAAVPSNLDEIIEVVKFNELVSGLFVNHVGIKREEIPPEYVHLSNAFSSRDLKASKMCFIYYKALALQCIILLSRDSNRDQGLFIPISKAFHDRSVDGRSHFRTAKYIPNDWPEQMRNVVGFKDDRLHCLITKIKYKLYAFSRRDDK